MVQRKTNRWKGSNLLPALPGLSGLFAAAGTIGCISTILGFFGSTAWSLDLFAHFRVQYFAGLCTLGFLMLLLKHRRTGSIFCAFAVVNLATILPLYLPFVNNHPSETKTTRAMLLNVNTSMGNPGRVKEVIKEIDPDFVVLEEINADWVSKLQWLSTSHSNSIVEPREDNFGIGLYSRLPLAQARIVNIGTAGVPSIVAVVRTGQGLVTVIATHPLPPRSAEYSKYRNKQLAQIPDHVPTSAPTILLGDLNVTPWSPHFKSLLKSTGMKDATQGRGVQPTWPNLTPLLRIPIDHCLHSPDITVVNKRVGPDAGSDHFPIIVDFAASALKGSEVRKSDR